MIAVEKHQLASPSTVIASVSEAIHFTAAPVVRWIASSQLLLAMTLWQLAYVTKKPAGVSSGGSLLSPDLRLAYAFMLAFTASAVIGNERTRAPQALKIALPSAGAITVTAGSPTPVAFSPLAMTLMATSGI